MTVTPKTRVVRSGIRRRYGFTGRAATQAVLGNEDGAISVVGQPHYYWVQIATGKNTDGTTQYGNASPILSGAGYLGTEKAGTAVYVGYAYDGKLAIVGTDRDELLVRDINPRIENPNSPYNKFVNSANIVIGYVGTLGTGQTDSMEVLVYPLTYIDANGVQQVAAPNGAQFDFTSDIPAADGDGNNQKVIVGLFINSSNTLVSFASTAKIATDTLTWTTDVAEVVAAASVRALPLRYYVLTTGQTTMTELDEFGDGRPWVTQSTANDNVDMLLFGFVCDETGAYDSTIAFDGTNTFTLAPTGTTWEYWRNGLYYKITGSKTVTLSGAPPADKGLYYIVIDNATGTLTASTVAWTLEDTQVPVATVVWDNALTPKYWLSDERHTVSYGRRNHLEHHFADGTEVVTRPVLTGYTVTPAGPADTDNTFAISQSVTFDEDIKTTQAALGDPGGVSADYVVQYRTAAAVWDWASSLMPYRYTAAGYIQYDNAGTMTQGANNKYYNWFLLLTNEQGAARFTFIPGQSEFSSLAATHAEEFQDLTLTGISINEYVAVFKFTWQTSAAYGTLGKARLAEEPLSIAVSGGSSGVSGATDHGSLSGLTDDDHVQYLLTDGTRALAGPWDMNNQATTNVNIDSGEITGITDLAVADGGTGRSVHTAYGVLCGGTTTTAAQQSIISVGTLGQVLTSNGAGALPTMQAAGGGSGTDINSTVNGRLTLTTVTPVTDSDVTAATTIYFSPYKGKYISLYDGSSAWDLITFTEISIAVPATTSTVYDIFGYNNAGTATLELLAWASGTARATALVKQDGVIVKTGATTRRYLGSFRTTGVSGQTEDSDLNRLLNNYYNQKQRRLGVFETADNWTYAVATWRSLNNSTANRVTFVSGTEETLTYLAASLNGNQTSTAINFFVGVGLDSTSVNSAYTHIGGGGAQIIPASAIYEDAHLGYHYLQLLERPQAALSVTLYGDAGLANKQIQSGGIGYIMG